ncbi:hypothetical protein GCM10010123_46100 [Pilimelia anulata]|uniref:HTH cro/C1-type domain-containing protein n=1 Tax=Pilimelia anulata TaxID=53371 RepID=A0A8J3FF07_9ACTN|nr:helix-turn-helix transcriptional regulator [Pilimelia anulata]GGK10944.1 hypothetical protein GCM10010123_46100 [Pilimelia anulata]
MATATPRPSAARSPADHHDDPHRAIHEAAHAFAAELARWRHVRGLSKKQLALRMRFDPSYVSHIERCRHRPTADFARRAEAVLLAGGSLWRRFEEYDRLRRTSVDYRPAGPPPWLPPTAGLVVERELARLTVDVDSYRCMIRRDLYNAGTEAVTRFAVKVGVDRWPEDPARSRAHHHDHPLTFDSLGLTAHCTVGDRREPMQWQPGRDRDVTKEAWLLFRNATCAFPLEPGGQATLEYEIRINAANDGRWFQRIVRLPTGHLTLEVDLPGPAHVRGTVTSPVTAPVPIRLTATALDDERMRYRAVSENPPLQASYRLEWWADGPVIPRPRVTPR